MIYFTSDQHYGHKNIIQYCNRPFSSVEEMDETMIQNHNSVVSKNDTVIHCGDFYLGKGDVDNYISRLNGIHKFVMGSHDRWSHNKLPYIIEESYYLFGINEKVFIVACHYAMRVWAKSHYNSWHVYGHSHGNLPSVGKSYDVGVDINNFTPVSLVQLKEIMDRQPDNFNLVKR